MADRMTEDDGFETVYATRGNPQNTVCGRVVVDANHVDRLNKIERVARAVVDAHWSAEGRGSSVFHSVMWDLREALRS